MTRRRCRSLTRPAKRAVLAADPLGRDFTAPAPGMKLVGDLTFIAADLAWPYLATWLDLATLKSSGAPGPTATAPLWSSTRWS